MNAASRQLIRAAHYKEPDAPQRIGAWTGNTEAFDVLAARLVTLDEWWSQTTPIEARRMFLVLCALDHDEVTKANWAAYHGGEDSGL